MARTPLSVIQKRRYDRLYKSDKKQVRIILDGYHHSRIMKEFGAARLVRIINGILTGEIPYATIPDIKSHAAD